MERRSPVLTRPIPRFLAFIQAQALPHHLVFPLERQGQQLAQALCVHDALRADDGGADGVGQGHDQVGVAPRPPLLLASLEAFVGGVRRERRGQLQAQERVVLQVVEGLQLVGAKVIILKNAGGKKARQRKKERKRERRVDNGRTTG